MAFKRFLVGFAILFLAAETSLAEVKLPAIFSEHLVLQQKQTNPVWGWAAPGETVTVTIGEQSKTAKADANGKWRVKLDPLPAGGPHKMTFKGKDNQIEYKDILIGEVWVCSGQSNMAMTVSRSNAPKLEELAANFPKIRFITVPRAGSQTPAEDFVGQWEHCSPKTVGNFSAVGYYFGRQIHQTTGVPIGLINDSYGGSAAEAWVRRDVLDSNPRYKKLMDKWAETEKTYDFQKSMDVYNKRFEQWKAKRKEATKAGKPAPRPPRKPRNVLTGNQRPANLYNAMLNPVIGYGIRGAIWYQGESNSSRAHQYRDLFPLMISHWREVWGQGDFPFYWVQLADYRPEVETPGDSDWAELREAQTMTLKLENSGEAVIVDVGEGDDIHPRDKQTVGKRLARWALAKDYGIKIDYQSPNYKSHEIKGNKVTLTFDSVDSQLKTFDTKAVIGFTIAGEDKKFVKAVAKIVGKDKVVVSSPMVKNPVAVRYGWADNPICNVHDGVSRLPLNPFRTDKWDGITVGVEHR